jgi:hypothetical protein
MEFESKDKCINKFYRYAQERRTQQWLLLSSGVVYQTCSLN